MKRIQTIASCAIALALFLIPASPVPAQTPTSREYPTLYKSARTMGMGGAAVAIGGRGDALFTNPAGLANIPKDKGWDVNLLNISVEAGQKAIDFVKDAGDALDTADLNNDGSSDDDQEKALNNVLANYRGEPLHLRIADFTSFSRSYDSFALGFGVLASGRMDARAHQGFGPEGFLELDADATYGAVGGFSFPVEENLFFGFGIKGLKRESVVHNFSARELVEHGDNLDDYILDQVRKQGSALGFDAGLLWKFSPDSWWRPAAGLSVMNIGDLKFAEAGTIPMTVNAGISVNPQISWFRSLILGADYVDILNNYEQDKDMMKRLRLGGELQLFDVLPIEMAIRAGLYQGNPTFGADLRLFFMTLSYAMYTEEVGAYAGQDKDKRQLLTLNIGW